MRMTKRIIKAAILKLLGRAALCIPIVSLGMFLLVICGCKELEQAVDRHGDYFYLTKNYGSSSVGFSLWGKQLMHQNDGKFVLFPAPSAIFPGIPLFFVEKCVICPVIDICLLPTDFWRNIGAGEEENIRENGCYVQVMDVFGRPVPGVEVRMHASNMNLMPIVYKGRRQKTLAARGLTDKNGELFIPVDMTTVDRVHRDVSTAGTCGKGRFEMTHYERVYRHPPFTKGLTYGSRFYRQLSPKDIEDPDQLFPQRDNDHIIRVVLEPELVWPDGRNAQWSFIPEKSDNILRTNCKYWSAEALTEYDNLTDIPPARLE